MTVNQVLEASGLRDTSDRHIELKLSDGRTVQWAGKDGIDAGTRYVDAHRGACVVAWRECECGCRSIGGYNHHTRIIE